MTRLGAVAPGTHLGGKEKERGSTHSMRLFSLPPVASRPNRSSTLPRWTKLGMPFWLPKGWMLCWKAETTLTRMT